MADNPAAIGCEHIDIVDACLMVEGCVAQRGEGATTVGTEGQKAVLRAGPQESSFAPPHGVEPLRSLFVADVLDAVPQHPLRRGPLEIFTPHVAYDDCGVAVESYNIFIIFTVPTSASQLSLL